MRRGARCNIFVLLFCSGLLLNFINCVDDDGKDSKQVMDASEETGSDTTKGPKDDLETSSSSSIDHKSEISESKYKNGSTPSKKDFILAKKVRTDCPRDDLEYRRLYNGKCRHSANHISAFSKPEDRSVPDKNKMTVNFQNKRLLHRVISVGVFGDIVPPHAPKMGFKLLDMSVSIFSKMCSKVPVDFVSNAFKLYHDLHWVTGQGRSDVLTEVDFKWIVKLLKNCSANAKPFTPQMDHCEEELLGASACRNFICTNPEHEFKLYRADPLVDMMWKIYEIVHAVCFPAFEESYRMHHKYAQAIMDLFTQPIRVRWLNQLADNMFWKRTLGPNYEMHLVNMERCVQESISRAVLPYRLPKHTITDKPRMDGDQGNTPSCAADYKNVIIQFALVQDVTYTYGPFVATLASIMPDFLKTLTDTFPETEFAITSFVDYPWMDVDNLYFFEPGVYCYKLGVAFTKEHGPITEAVSSLRIQNGGPDGPEGSLTGMLFTAVEPKLGWYSTPFVKGKKVYKILAMTTDERWKEKNEAYPIETPQYKPASRPDSLGDGTDTCENFPPDAKIVRDVMEKNNIYFLGLIAPHRKATWQGYMDKHEFKPEQYKLVALDPGAANDLARSLVKQFKAMVHADQCGLD